MNKTSQILIVAILLGLGAWGCREKPLEIAPEIAASAEALY